MEEIEEVVQDSCRARSPWNSRYEDRRQEGTCMDIKVLSFRLRQQSKTVIGQWRISRNGNQADRGGDEGA